MSYQNLTFSRLVNQLTDYGERTDEAYVNEIPVFIMLAENRLATEMKQQGFQAVVNGKFDQTVSQPKPSFWRETISFSYLNADNEIVPLYLRSLEYCKAYWPRSALTTSGPMYYADYNSTHFYVAGTPAGKYPFELVYYARLEPLSAEHQENWMTLNAPQALLYACLLEAALWKKNMQDVQTYKGEFGEAMGGLLNENKERLADRGTVVERG